MKSAPRLSHVQFVSALLVFVATFVGTANVPAALNEGCVQFDVPAILPACDITGNEAYVVHSNNRLIEIVIPCSTLIGCRDPQQVLQLMIQVRGMSSGLQVADYQPRTQMYADVDGPVSVEQRSEKNFSIGIDAAGSVSEAVGLKANAGAGKKNSTIERFEKIPGQQLLLASGTIDRGSGVYFKFQQSPQTTLEGGHQLVITLRAPASWRGGLLRVDCQASGSEKYLIAKNEQFRAGSQSFVVATFLKGDFEAQQIADRYSQIESLYRKYARSLSQQQSKKPSPDPFSMVNQWFGSDKKPSGLPVGWAERFMLYDNRSLATKVRPHLSDSMQRATDQFVAARRQLLQLSR